MTAETLKAQGVPATELDPSASAVHPEADGTAVVGRPAVSVFPLWRCPRARPRSRALPPARALQCASGGTAARPRRGP
eukprot:9088886-Alexandrium_andersonii.AAC.1